MSPAAAALTEGAHQPEKLHYQCEGSSASASAVSYQRLSQILALIVKSATLQVRVKFKGINRRVSQLLLCNNSWIMNNCSFNAQQNSK